MLIGVMKKERCMNKADKYFRELLQDINENGVWSKEPRTRWTDGEKAHYKSVYHKSYTYDLSKGEFPITTMRKTALRGCFEEMRWIYQLQSNIIEDAHPCIWSWWKEFSRLKIDVDVLNSTIKKLNDVAGFDFATRVYNEDDNHRSIGATYGYVVKKYDLMNKLLHNLEHNPESRRNIINLWDNQCQMEDLKALPPCAYMTKWVVREQGDFKYIDVTLYQRSRDIIMVYSINPLEYVMLQMMVCGHLTYKTGVLHKLGILTHHVEDEHVYDRNMWAVKELLERQPTGLQPKVELICEPKDFYNYRWEDFKFTGLEGIEPLSKKLEIAI